MDTPYQYRSPYQVPEVTSPPTTPTRLLAEQSRQDTDLSPITNQHYSPAEEAADALSKATLANSPDDTNTCVLLTGLPLHTTSNQILAKIKGIGRVYDIMTFLSQPNKETMTSGISFFKREAAERFLALCWEGRFNVNGCIPGATFLDSQLAQIIPEADPEVIDHGSILGQEGHMIGRMEYRFASYPSQAYIAVELLESRFGPQQLLTVEYGEDPCAWSENFEWKA
ncbi:hypothetical protein F4776DRAFT_660398 [Hypoxylon sp. NC0597]|nr:hypothetical protein F4776DRAFT_660398 [Hypoxylon sp. NC0597]